MTNAVQTDTPDSIVLKPTQTPNQQSIIDTAQGDKPLGTITQGPGSPYKLQLYSGKGGFTAIVTSAKTDLRYFVLPGGRLTVGDTEIQLEGEPFKLGKVCSEPLKSQRQQAKLDISLQTMVLGAGLATRFEPVSGENSGYSKPAVFLAGETAVIEAIANGLYASGFPRLFVNTYFKPVSLKAVLSRTEQAKGDTLTYIDEPAPSGTAGALRKLLQSPAEYGFDPSKPLLLVQGDAVTDADFARLYEAHKKNNALVTIGCMEVPETQVQQFGIVVSENHDKADKSGNIIQFQEKPKFGEHLSTLANTGFYLFSPDAFEIILQVFEEMGEAGEKELDFAKNIFPAVLKKSGQTNRPFWAHQIESDSYWNDIGNPRQYLETVHDVFQGKVCLPLPKQPEQYFENGVLYWPKAKPLAESESAKAFGNVIVAKPF
ncbi:MAG: nucleotidyltransferase family protein [Vampirovibrionales bacterium]|nr:nucleotidyltransferase family protein [Vampirovibrionales bacterium]